MQAWWQQLQGHKAAAWLASSMRANIIALRGSSPAASSQQPAAREGAGARGGAAFALIPGPPPLQGQLLSLQRALEDRGPVQSLQAACQAMAPDMTVHQVSECCLWLPLLHQQNHIHACVQPNRYGLLPLAAFDHVHCPCAACSQHVRCQSLVALSVSL